jgi:K+-transporting ATPase c subunit
MISKFPHLVFSAVLVIVVAAIACINPWRKQEPIPVSIDAERVAADAVLAEKLSGPRYFSVPADAVPEEGGPWIKEHQARAQIPGIVAERKLGPGGERALDQLVDKLTEHHPSRVLGGMRINLLRLNLSLDSIK